MLGVGGIMSAGYNNGAYGSNGLVAATAKQGLVAGPDDMIDHRVNIL